MGKQERIQKTKSKPEKNLDQTIKEASKVDTKQGLKDDLDSLLDEVDKVLETNAEEFVKGYVQKGGE